MPGPIPACAGQPHAPRALYLLLGAYPRVCGATGRAGASPRPRLGLSPRVRGNLLQLVNDADCIGPIPACAGQPRAQGSTWATSRAYPRVCGATYRRIRVVRFSMGLSPRVRGNRNDIHARRIGKGPIPACAGQPTQIWREALADRAYPRVCGATSSLQATTTGTWGLSPRVRGNRNYIPDEGFGAGPIPACAGQPGVQCGPLSARRAYPRVCGATTPARR